MSQVTATTTVSSLKVMCSGALTTIMTVTMAAISKGCAAGLVQHDVALSPLLILRDTMRDVVGLATTPEKQPES